MSAPVKRPAFQFYPDDWMSEPGLRAVSSSARGLWIDLMCIMHKCLPYGHLVLNGQPMTNEQIARQTGGELLLINLWIKELESADVFSRGRKNEIFSRRMVKDERVRAIRASAGKLGGNPALLNHKVNLRDNLSLKQKPTPSSSSSKEKEKETAHRSVDN